MKAAMRVILIDLALRIALAIWVFKKELHESGKWDKLPHRSLPPYLLFGF